MTLITDRELAFVREHYHTLGAAGCARELDISPNRTLYIANKLLDLRHADSDVYRPRRRKPRTADSYAVNHEILLRVDSPIKAYVLGLLWADGSVRPYDPPHSYNAGVTFSTTYPDADELVPALQQIGKWRVYRIEPKERAPKAAARVMVTSRPLSDALIALGYRDRLAGFERVLAIVPSHLHRLWWLGFSDGDGCFYYHDVRGLYRFSVASGICQNWTALEQQLTSLGLEHEIERTKSPQGSYSKLHLGGKMRVAVWGHWLYDGHDMGLKRKRAKWEVIRDRCARRPRFDTL